MSFGFSVSDFYVCARLAYKLSEGFRCAPVACQEFKRDLLLFHHVLVKTGSAINSEPSHFTRSDRDALRLCLESCKELLCVRILGLQKVPEDFEKSGFNQLSDFFEFRYNNETRLGCLCHNWYRKFDIRKFASRIPDLQRAVSAHIEKLNALLILYVLMIDGLRFFAADLPMFQ